jgi:hypothetical protein
MSFRIMATGALLLVGLSLSTGRSADPKKAEVPPPGPLDAKLVTIKGKNLPLVKVLEMIRDQTRTAEQPGYEVVPPMEAVPDLTLDIDKMPFWQALDTIARRADVRVSLYNKDRKIALVNHAAGWREVPTSYHGIFRIQLKRLVQVRDLEDDSGAGLARLEVAWEPRFQAFYLETKPESLKVELDKGPVNVPNVEVGRSPAPNGIAMQFDLPLPPFPRSAKGMTLFAGTFGLIGSPEMLTFTFDKLAKGEKKMDRTGTVAVQLQSFRQGKELWSFDVGLQYPPGGPMFESFQSWLFQNQAYLLHKSGKRHNPDGVSDEPAGGQTAVVRYQFLFEDEKLAKPADWRLIYRTPAPVAEGEVKFAFKDVPLP